MHNDYIRVPLTVFKESVLHCNSLSPSPLVRLFVCFHAKPETGAIAGSARSTVEAEEKLCYAMKIRRNVNVTRTNAFKRPRNAK